MLLTACGGRYDALEWLVVHGMDAVSVDCALHSQLSREVVMNYGQRKGAGDEQRNMCRVSIQGQG